METLFMFLIRCIAFCGGRFVNNNRAVDFMCRTFVRYGRRSTRRNWVPFFWALLQVRAGAPVSRFWKSKLTPWHPVWASLLMLPKGPLEHDPVLRLLYALYEQAAGLRDFLFQIAIARAGSPVVLVLYCPMTPVSLRAWFGLTPTEQVGAARMILFHSTDPQWLAIAAAKLSSLPRESQAREQGAALALARCKSGVDDEELRSRVLSAGLDVAVSEAQRVQLLVTGLDALLRSVAPVAEFNGLMKVLLRCNRHEFRTALMLLFGLRPLQQHLIRRLEQIERMTSSEPAHRLVSLILASMSCHLVQRSLVTIAEAYRRNPTSSVVEVLRARLASRMVA